MRTLFCLSSAFLNVTPSVLGFPSSIILEDTVCVESNVSWQIVNNTNFASVTPLSGNGTQNITISLTENLLQQSRSGTITVRNLSLGLSKDITINQSGQSLPPLEP